MRHIYKKGHQRVLMVATIVGQRMQRQPKECKGNQKNAKEDRVAYEHLIVKAMRERERERDRERQLLTT